MNVVANAPAAAVAGTMAAGGTVAVGSAHRRVIARTSTDPLNGHPSEPATPTQPA